jgi:hypothetical protein
MYVLQHGCRSCMNTTRISAFLRVQAGDARFGATVGSRNIPSAACILAAQPALPSYSDLEPGKPIVKMDA